MVCCILAYKVFLLYCFFTMGVANGSLCYNLHSATNRVTEGWASYTGMCIALRILYYVPGVALSCSKHI